MSAGDTDALLLFRFLGRPLGDAGKLQCAESQAIVKRINVYNDVAVIRIAVSEGAPVYLPWIAQVHVEHFAGQAIQIYSRDDVLVVTQ